MDQGGELEVEHAVVAWMYFKSSPSVIAPEGKVF